MLPFQDYIGLRGACNNSTPISGLFINDLPGISLDMLDALTEPEQATYLNMWASVQRRAWMQFVKDARYELQKKYKLFQNPQMVDLGTNIDPNTTFAPLTGNYRGLGFMFSLQANNTQMFAASAFEVVHVQSLNLYDHIGGQSTTLYAIDVDKNTIVWSQAITCIQGWNQVQVDQDFYVRRLLLVYDAATFNSVSLPMLTVLNAYRDFYYAYTYMGFAQALMYGIQTPKNAVANLTTGWEMYGLSAVLNVQCKYDRLYANNKEMFSSPWMYLLGRELMLERRASNRLNRFTTIDVKKAEELYNYFDSQYKAYLTQICENISINDYDYCIDCNPQVKMQTVQP